MSRPNPESSNFIVAGCSYSNWTGYFSGFTRSINGYNRDYTSINTPSYYSKSNTPGALPVNTHHVHIVAERMEFIISKRYTDTITGKWDQWYDTYRALVAPNALPNLEYQISHSKQGYEKAKQRCIDRVKSQDFNVAVACAEAQKTMDMVGDTASTIARAVLAFKRGKVNQGFKILGIGKPKDLLPKSVADRWLAVQYGWVPLLSDVRAAAEQLAKRQFPPSFHFVGKSSDSDSRRREYFSLGLGGITFSEQQYNCESKVSMSFRKKNHTARTMSELGISDPLLVVWELVPYSFVVDWFLPVGKYLQSLDYTSGLTFTSGYTLQYSTNRWYASTPVYSTPSTKCPGGAVLTARNVLLDRVALNAPLSASLPRLKNPLSTTHMLNGLALLAKSFR